MNNSKITFESVNLSMQEPPDLSPAMRQKETELLEILDAINHIKASNYWKLLHEKVLTGVLAGLQRRIRSEKNPTEIYRLQGQIVWAEKYTDLDKLAQAYQNELSLVRKQLNG